MLEDDPEQEGDFTVLSPQNSLVVPIPLARNYFVLDIYVPQNPYLLQQTFKGHFSALDHCGPHPGSHSDLLSQPEVQFPAPQNVGPRPQIPYLPQHPILHGDVAEQVGSAQDARDAKIEAKINKSLTAPIALTSRPIVVCELQFL